MPKGPVTTEIAEFLAKPNPAVIASNRPDGQPVSVATWYVWDDGRILVNMSAMRKPLQEPRGGPRIPLTRLAGLADRAHRMDHVDRQLAGCAVRHSAPQRPRHFQHAEPAAQRGAGGGQLLPVVRAELADPDHAVEVVRVGGTQGGLRAG